VSARTTLKRVAYFCAVLAVLPALASYHLRTLVVGRDRALEGSSQAFSLVPGIVGQYLRRAFLGRVLAQCDWTVTVEFGTQFSTAGARLESDVYIGPGCHIGLAHLQRGVLIGAGVHIPSGGHIHGTEDPCRPIREQEGHRTMVTIGSGSWVGSRSVIMADVGRNTVIGAGSVVTRAVPDAVIAAGVPVRVLRSRGAEPL
jgi:acetyltransferase-like isoleucine patch superfamily enzyme